MQNSAAPCPHPDQRPLLPNEPRVLDWSRSETLTERYLMPALPALEAFFLDLRARLDPVLMRTQPVKRGKPYPLGQCLEISQAVKRVLPQLAPAMPSGQAATGHAALKSFLQNGGSMRQVWGDLRGEYFQNAFLAGTLYIDVSNDTVVPTKPKVEILPFVDARFSPLEDYAHFVRVAERYWNARLFPNHVLPSLAPYFPLISAGADGSIRFQSVSDYMIALTQAGEFLPSVAVLDATSMDADVFRRIAGCFAGASVAAASDPAQGRALGLQNCKTYRADRWHQSDERRTWAIKAVLDANKRLTQLAS